MLCHAINNTLSVLMVFLGWEVEGVALHWIWLAASGAILIAALCWLIRKVPAAPPPADAPAALVETPAAL